MVKINARKERGVSCGHVQTTKENFKKKWGEVEFSVRAPFWKITAKFANERACK